MSAATSFGTEIFTEHRVTRFIGLRGSLAADQTARMLQVLVAILAVWMAATWVATIPFAQARFSFPRTFYPSVLEASYATALVLLRLGNFRRASLAYLAGTWIWATLVSSSFGGIHSPGALLYVSLPASAAWLLGYEGALWTAGGCLLSALVFTVLEIAHVGLPLQAKATPLGIWAVIVQAVLINAIPVGQIIGRLRETARARQRAGEELQTAYSELRNQKEMLQTIFDHIPMMINFGDGEFGIQMVNRTWTQTLGWTLDEIRRDNVDILVENYPDPQYRAQVRDFVLNTNGEWANLKTTVRDGRVIDASWMMLHLPDGTKMGIGLDVTERMRAEEALRENERRLVSIYNTVADVIFHLAVEPGGRFRFLSVNPAFLRTTGMSLEAVVGKTVNEVIPEPSLTIVLGKYRQAIEENAIVHWEETSDYPSGRLTGEASVAPIFDDQGICTNLVGSVHDITERKRAAEDLRTSRDEIRAHAARLVTAQEDERRRLSIEVHDQICQDLAAIAIELGGFAATPPPREDVAARFRALQARVVKAANEAGHIAYQLHPSVLDHLGLPSALQDLCNQFAKRAPTIALEFTSGTLPPSVPREVAACLYRIARESLQNTARHSSAKHGSVALTWQDRTIVLIITDDGVGFDPQVARENGGLGIIGMEERARSVNGKLTLAAEPGSGTRIALEVPLPLPA
jgi:PAS domain S-box-containing protein